MKSGGRLQEKGATSPARVAYFDRVMIIMEKRIAGKDYETIWEEMKEMGEDYSYAHPQSVRNALYNYMQKAGSETAEVVRELELRRYNEMLSSIWYQIVGGVSPDGERHIGGHLGAIKTAQGILTRIDKIYGLEAPIKIAKTDSHGRDVVSMTDQERADRIWQIVEEAQKKALENGETVDGELLRTERKDQEPALVPAAREKSPISG